MIRNLPQKLLNRADVVIDGLVTPHEKKVRQFTGRPYAFSVIAVLLFFLANYLFNHGQFLLTFLPEGGPMYFFTVILPFGIIMPSLTLGWLIREADGEAHIFGATVKVRDFKMTLAALIAGAVITVYPVVRGILGNPAGVYIWFHLFVWITMQSLAEVLLFIGAIFNTTQWLALKWLPGRNRVVLRTAIAMTLAAFVFAIYHFSYPIPWNNWQMMLLLFPVGLLIALVFSLTRSMMATVVFNNVITVASYITMGATISGSDTLAIVFSGIALFAAILIIVLVGVYDEDY